MSTINHLADDTRIPDTIFDEPTDAHNRPDLHQRVCGFFFLNGINPAAVLGGRRENGRAVEACAIVTGIDGDQSRVRVRFAVIVLAEGTTQWSAELPEGRGVPIPAGISCDHGSEPHKASRLTHLDVPLTEVAL